MQKKEKKRVWMPPLRSEVFQDKREKKRRTRSADIRAAIEEQMELLDETKGTRISPNSEVHRPNSSD